MTERQDMKAQGEGQDAPPPQQNQEQDQGNIPSVSETSTGRHESGNFPPPPTLVVPDPQSDSSVQDPTLQETQNSAGDVPQDSLAPPGHTTTADNNSQHEEGTTTIQYRKFTRQAYRRLVIREQEEKRKAQERKDRPQEGRLVDGELRFDDGEDDDEDRWERDPSLVEGNNLPEHLAESFPKELFGQAIEEIDPHILDKTFVVIARRFRSKYIHRFSATKAFFLLSPWSRLRCAAISVSTNQFFDFFIILTILCNCVFLAMRESSVTVIAEYVFLAIYTLEAIIKLTAKGFIINSFTYLRDGWNWLDFMVIIVAYLTLILEYTGNDGTIGNIAGLRTFRVLRALKTVSIVPGLKTIISALLRSLRMLAQVIILTVFCMMVFALFALQVYIGVLRNKCVKNLPDNTTFSHANYSSHIKTQANWLEDPDGGWLLCGNSSGAGPCPSGYTCLPNIGENPNFGYTNFDDFGWSMLNSLQLITLDFWEDIYDKIIRANGPLNIIFFVMVVFFGSFYLINLMLAVVSMSYEEEASVAGKEEKKNKEAKKRAKKKAAAEAAALVKTVDSDKVEDPTKMQEEKKNKNDKSQSDTNHLQVMKAVNGSNSNSASSTSLMSVGNGVRSRNSPVRDDVNSVHNLPKNGRTPPLNSKKTEEDSEALQQTFQDTRNEKAAIKRRKSQDGGDQDPEKGPDVAPSNAAAGSNEKLVERDEIEEIHTLNDDGRGAHINPMATMSSEDDSNSVSSSENAGDAPVIVVKDDDDEELVDRNCECCGRCCRCFVPWLRAQNFLHRIVSDIIFELVISFFIGVNVIVMALEHFQQPYELGQALFYLNIIFTVIFTLEAVLKIFAMSKHYFKSKWNLFDLIIVVAGLIDVGVERVKGFNIIRVFRLLRLLRVFKLAHTWSTMRILLAIIVRTMGALGNLTFILIIAIYIFAVIGMQLFMNSYTPDKFYPDEKPRWNFDDFPHAVMLVFRILCGEWIEPMWDCMRAAGPTCMFVFLPTLVFGNFMVLNLFLALLLNSFATDSLRKNKEGKSDNKVQKGWLKLKGLFQPKQNTIDPDEQLSKKPSIADILAELKRHKLAMYEEQQKADEEGSGEDKDKSIEMKDMPANGDVINKEGHPEPKQANGIAKKMPKDMDETFQTNNKRDEFAKFPVTKAKDSDPEMGETSGEKVPTDTQDKTRKDSKGGKTKKPAVTISEDKGEDDDDASSTAAEVEDCFPPIIWDKLCKCFADMDETKSGQRWYAFRVAISKVSEHKAFEYFILIIILASSITLCFEDIYLDEQKDLKLALDILDVVFLVLFIIEMLLKWVAQGFRKYFTSFWTVLDFCIVVISITSIAAKSTGTDNISSLRSLRTLRALRPLRAISRWQGMRIVVNALMYAIPSIFNVLLVCLVFWLIFSIAGVQLFMGKFYKCEDADGNRMDSDIVPNKTICLKMKADGMGTDWVNSKVNFDNAGIGYLALFQVATFEGWIEVMRDAVDMTAEDQQPKREHSLWAYSFFAIFIICGSFFTLNLFIGVIIDNFNMLKKKYEGNYLDAFLTSSQRNYYNTMKKLGNRKPQKTIKRPKNKVQGFFFDVSVSTKFELAVVVLILLNMCAMAVEHYRQPQMVTDALDITNIVFTTIFTLEAVVKIVGLRWHYFRRAWNVFDFIIVILSIVGVILDDALRNMFITPTLLRVVRVFRIGRVLRLIKAAKGIRKLLFALVISLPALFNIGMLLLLIIFIYSIIGMTSFGNVRHTGALDDLSNFETFFKSMVLLFRLTTSAGWNEVLGPLMNTNNCNSTHRIMPDGVPKEVPNGDCGNPSLAIFYMVSYILITYLIIINMYIAVILENFNQAHQQEEVGITEDDFEMFYVVWERYDPHATQFIKYEYLPDLVSDLDMPLGIPKPNEIALVAFDLPIVEGDRLHCLDILISLVKHVLGSVEETDDFLALKGQMELKFRSAFPTRVTQTQISTTMKRKKEDVAAKTLQRAWRKHKAQRSIRKITEMAMEAQLSRSLTRSSFTMQRQPSSTLSSPRPESAGSNKQLKPSAVAQQKRQLTNKLQIPSTNDIRLPSDEEL